MQKNSNPPPTHPRPSPPPTPPKANQEYEGMTNAEVYGALALVLIELQKINQILDRVYCNSSPVKPDVGSLLD